MRFFKPRLSPEAKAIVTMLDERREEWRDGPKRHNDRVIDGPCGTRIQEFCYEGCGVTVTVGGDLLDLTLGERTAIHAAYRRWAEWKAEPLMAQWKANQAARRERIRAALLSDTCAT